MDHTTRAVLAQCQVDGGPGEVPGFQPLLRELDLAGVVVTADALHTHRGAAEFLVAGKQAHYLFTVKAAHPAGPVRPPALAPRPSWTAPATAPTAAWSYAPSGPSRSLGSVPYAAQVIQVTRKTATYGPGGGGP